ncbi:hypothetical protein YC2023_046131 [Brassica napus]
MAKTLARIQGCGCDFYRRFRISRQNNIHHRRRDQWEKPMLYGKVKTQYSQNPKTIRISGCYRVRGLEFLGPID